MREKKVGILTIGWSKYAFEDCTDAMQVMALLEKSVVVSHQYSMPAPYEKVRYTAADSDTMVQLELIPQALIDALHTNEQLREIVAREMTHEGETKEVAQIVLIGGGVKGEDDDIPV